MPVLFNVFEDWNEESVVLHISFVSFVDYSTPDSYSTIVAGNKALGGIYGQFNSIIRFKFEL